MIYARHKWNRSVLCLTVGYISGGADYEKAVTYVKEQFMARKPEDRDIYVHVTCATDTDPMKTVLQNVFEILVEVNLKKIAVL